MTKRVSNPPPPKGLRPPPPASPPPMRIIRENSASGSCPVCGSSVERRWLIGPKKCINSQCRANSGLPDTNTATSMPKCKPPRRIYAVLEEGCSADDFVRAHTLPEPERGKIWTIVDGEFLQIPVAGAIRGLS